MTQTAHCNRPLTDAQRELAGQWTRLAFKVAREFQTQRPGEMESEEIDREALLALLSAARAFDAARGFQFSTYATWAIRYRLLRAAKVHARKYGLRKEVCEAEAFATVDHRHGRPDVLAEASEVAAVARRVLSRSDHKVFWWRFAIGMHYVEIGKRLGISKQAAAQRANAAMHTVREHFGVTPPTMQQVANLAKLSS